MVLLQGNASIFIHIFSKLALSAGELSVSNIRFLVLHAQTKKVEVGQRKRKFIR